MQSDVWAALATPDRAWLLRQGELRFGLFSGAPVVEVSPEQWALDPAVIRQAAATRRYREIPPGQDGLLRFEFVPQFSPPPFDHPCPGTPARVRRLTRLVSGQDQVWTSLRRLGVSRADVARVAEAEGLHVVHEVADPADRLLLLRRPSLPGELISLPYRGPWYRRIDVALLQTGVILTAFAGIMAAVLWSSFDRWGWGPFFLVVASSLGLLAGLVLIKLVGARTARITWLDEPFDGRPTTPVPLAGISTELRGDVAAAYGYFFGGPYRDPHVRNQPATGLFVKCRPGLLFGPPLTRPPTPHFDQAEEHPGREQWLLNRISGADDVWISVREAKLPRQLIAEIAAQERLAVSLEFADPTDRVLKLSRDPAPPRLPLPIPIGRRRFRVSFLNFLLPIGWLLSCVIPALVISAVSGDNRVFALGFGLGMLLLPAMAWALRAFPRSTRVGWLAKEFNGANSVTFFVGPYGVSPGLALQIAEAHGYFFGKQSATRAQGTFVTFVKRR